MRIAEVIAEEINPDIYHEHFKHRQQFGDFIYTAKTLFENGRVFLMIDAFDGKQQIGHVEFYTDPVDDALVSGMTWVKGPYKGLGIASTMYAYAKMLGNDIMPSQAQSDAGREMWQKWRRSGDIQHITPKGVDPYQE